MKSSDFNQNFMVLFRLVVCVAGESERRAWWKGGCDTAQPRGKIGLHHISTFWIFGHLGQWPLVTVSVDGESGIRASRDESSNSGPLTDEHKEGVENWQCAKLHSSSTLPAPPHQTAIDHSQAAKSFPSIEWELQCWQMKAGSYCTIIPLMSVALLHCHLNGNCSVGR